MNITQKQAIDAYKAVRKLEYQDMPGECAVVLFKLRRALEPQYEFQDEQEHKFVNTLDCSISGNGEIVFKDDESRNKYLEKVKELGELEVEVNIKKQKFSIKDLKLSPNDIAALEPIFDIVC